MEQKRSYFSQTIRDFFEGVFNVFIFLPYFFSVPVLLKTLFAPWKNLRVVDTESAGFQKWANGISSGLISSGMGFAMRSSLILFYGLVQSLYIIVLPLIIVLFFVLLPIMYVLSVLRPDEEQKKALLQASFLKKHVLKPENQTQAIVWFNRWHEGFIHNTWWKLSSLFSTPPLARDWSAGYTPTLDEFTTELTGNHYQKDRTHMIGRQDELKSIERALNKTEYANIVIVGDEGVGKRTIIDSFARRIFDGQVGPLLMYKRVLELDMEKILTRFNDLKQREEFFETLLKEAEEAKNIILVIENIDRYLAEGDKNIDLTSSIEKFARSSSVQIMGITTPYQYEKYFASSDKLARFFVKIEVTEINSAQAKDILLDAALIFERRYGLTIPYETVIETVEKSEHYITSIPFPEKALQLLDETCAAAKQTEKTTVMPDDIDTVLKDKIHVPITLSGDMKVKLLELESLLRQDIVHQDQAINEVASGLRRSFLLMGKRDKPLASFLFLGPTGVGKTETAKSIAKVFFGSDGKLLRFDMSNYQSSTNIPQLIGSSDSHTPGVLTSTLREHPFGVLLLDEIEKADKDLLNIFLTMLDEGYFTDGYGKRVDCKNLIIVATSNAGNTAPSTIDIVQFLISQGTFSPEFLNRFDSIVRYQQLDKDAIIIVARSMLRTVTDDLFKMYKVTVQISDATLKNIIDKDYNPSFGARDMEHALRRGIEDQISKLILAGQAKEGDTIQL